MFHFRKYSITTRIKTYFILCWNPSKSHAFESIPLQQGLRQLRDLKTFLHCDLSKVFHYNKD